MPRLKAKFCDRRATPFRTSALAQLISEWRELQSQLEIISTNEVFGSNAPDDRAKRGDELEEQLILEQERLTRKIADYPCKSVEDALEKLKFWKHCAVPGNIDPDGLSLADQVALSAANYAAGLGD